MAVALRVAEAALGRPELSLICSDATFCKAIPVGSVAADAEIVRQGRTGAQVLVRLWALDPDNPDPTTRPQSDLMVLCVFGEVAESEYNFVGAIAPDVPDPLDCVDAGRPRLIRPCGYSVPSTDRVPFRRG